MLSRPNKRKRDPKRKRDNWIERRTKNGRISEEQCAMTSVIKGNENVGVRY